MRARKGWYWRQRVLPFLVKTVRNLFSFRQAFTHGFCKKRSLLLGFFTVLRTAPRPHLRILLDQCIWYFPWRNVLYYSVIGTPCLPQRWSFLTKTVKTVRNVPFLRDKLSKVRFLLRNLSEWVPIAGYSLR